MTRYWPVKLLFWAREFLNDYVSFAVSDALTFDRIVKLEYSVLTHVFGRTREDILFFRCCEPE